MNERVKSLPRDDYNTVTLQNAMSSSIVFMVSVENGKEVIRIENNGDIYVHGKLTINDEEVADGFRAFLKQQGFLK